MTSMREVKARRVFVGKLAYGGDLLEQITGICRQEGIQLGRVEAVGAVQKAHLAFYDQQKHQYEPLAIERPLEITKLLGNVSLKEGQPFVHAHITLADETGAAYGGHLAPGTVVFACEFVLEAFDGPPLERDLDDVTGLYLWTMPDSGK
jgi:uncharacterized protein